MDPNVQPAPAPPQPIQDVLPPNDSLGNPESITRPAAPASEHHNLSTPPLPYRNPIAGTALPQASDTKDAPVDDHALDGALKDITSNMKPPPPGLPAKPPKRKLLGFLGRRGPKKARVPKVPRPLATGHGQPPPAPTQAHPHPLGAQPPSPHAKSAAPPKLPKNKKITLPVIGAVIVGLVLIIAAFAAFKS